MSAWRDIPYFTFICASLIVLEALESVSFSIWVSDIPWRTISRNIDRSSNPSNPSMKVLSHTSNEHEWAKKATAGHTEYSQYYCIFPDRTVPNEFERTTRTVSPSESFQMGTRKV